MLGLAAPTAYDLRFRLLGVPVRVHPLFWLVMAILSGGDTDLAHILIFTACAFVSIMVHEFGHGLMARYFGYRVHEIVLYGMGGYCLSESERQSPWQRVAVLLAGPGAGFLLLGVVVALALLSLGVGLSSDLDHIRMAAFARFPYTLLLVVLILIQINLIWGIVNLFPIWPLDGGQLAEVFLTMYNRRQGTRWAHILSIVAAGGLALLAFQLGQVPIGIWFVYFAFINYQALQATRPSRYSYSDDDADWWKR